MPWRGVPSASSSCSLDALAYPCHIPSLASLPCRCGLSWEGTQPPLLVSKIGIALLQIGRPCATFAELGKAGYGNNRPCVNMRDNLLVTHTLLPVSCIFLQDFFALAQPCLRLYKSVYLLRFCFWPWAVF